MSLVLDVAHRWLIDLYRTDDGEHLAAAMIADGHGVVYPAPRP